MSSVLGHAGARVRTVAGLACVVLMGAGACTEPGGASAAESSSTVASSTTGTSTGTEQTTATSLSVDSTADSSDETTSHGGPLGEGDPCSLDRYGPACDDGLKCMPYTTGGPGLHDAFACFPVHRDPVALYEPCMWIDEPWSGLDNCGPQAFCADYDGDGAGTCTGTCMFSADDRSAMDCEDPEAFAGVGCQECFCTCERSCDPLNTSSCPEGEGCFAQAFPPFVCMPLFEEPLASGQNCKFVNSCGLGSLCLDASLFADCGSIGCCTDYCDLTEPNTCPDAAGGQECLPWFDPERVPPAYMNLGVCAHFAP